MQLRRHGVARQVGGEDVGEAAARGQEIAFRPQVRQHVGEEGGDGESKERCEKRETCYVMRDDATRRVCRSLSRIPLPS